MFVRALYLAMVVSATAKKLNSRMEAVLDWASVARHRTGDNPARWVGDLEEPVLI